MINILHHSQLDLAARCAGRSKGEERFSKGYWPETELDVPRLHNAQASIVCRNARQIDYGTHGIFIGDVAVVYVDGTPEPLVYLDGRYTRALEADACHA